MGRRKVSIVRKQDKPKRSTIREATKEVSNTAMKTYALSV